MSKDKDAKSTVQMPEIPGGTPTWSVGWTVLLVSVLGAFLTVYLAVQNEVKDYIDKSFDKDKMEITSSENREYKKYDMVMALVAEHAKQLTVLQEQLADYKAENVKLKGRIEQLEKELVICRKK